MNKIFEKYKLNKGNFWFSVIAMFASAVTFIIASYNINFDIVVPDSLSNFEMACFEMLKDAATVVFSTFGVNLLLGICIERKNKNKLYEEFFVDEVIKTREFYKRLSSEDKEKMLRGLELEHYYDGNNILREMCKNSRERIIKVKEKYFYENCEYIVTVTDKGSYFEKDIVRHVTVKSYEDKVTLTNFRLASVINNKIDGLNVCEITSITHNGTQILGKCKPVDEEFEQNGESSVINKRTIIYYDDKLHLTNSKAQKFTVRMITRCPKDDITSSFRASVPCRRFSVSYAMNPKNEKTYKLVAHTFGCCENAEDFSTVKHPSSASITFENLIYRDDGVVIVMNPE